MRCAALLLLILGSLHTIARADTSAITYGQTLTGTLAATSGEQDVFTFTAPATGRVLVRLVSVTGEQSVGVDLVRVGTGSVGQAAGIGPVTTIEQANVLSGQSYEIRVPPSVTGALYAGQTYRVFLQSTTAPVGATAVTIGSTPTGSIDQAGEMDFFTIAANAGDELLFTVNRTSGAVDPSAVVYFSGATCTPSYGLLDNTNNPTVQTQCLFSSTATYAFAVEDVDDAGTAALDNIETGGYGLTIECFSGGCLSATTTTTTVATTTTTTTIGGGTSTSTTVAGGTTTTTTTTLPLTQQLLPGMKLVLKDKAGKPQKRLLTLIVKDDTVSLGGGNGSSDDPRSAGATLRVRSTTGGFDATYTLPAGHWKVLGTDGANKGYRYVDKARVAGPVVSALLKPKQLKIVAKGTGLEIDLTAKPDPIDVVLSTGGTSYCARFGGTVTFTAGKKLTASNAMAPAACP